MTQKQVTTIRIDAVDPLFFRDGKPFTMGAETWADAQFPPSPSVIYGALRSCYFGEHTSELPLAGTPEDPTGRLKIHTIALQANTRPLFPLPLDYVSLKHTPKQEGTLLRTIADTPVSNCRLPRIITAEPEKQVDTIPQAFLTESDLDRYLCNPPDTVQYRTLEEYTVLEPKIGIGRNSATGTTAEGLLYRVDMRRLESRRKFRKPTQTLSFLVEFSGLDIPDEGFFTLGGEGRIVHYQASKLEPLARPELRAAHFKLYLATPAFFEHGWLPDWIDPQTFAVTGQYAQTGLRLEAAILGKPVSIGGFDMAAGEPKPQRKAVPAGSVYYFRANGDVQQLVNLLHGQCISTHGFAPLGFGLAFAGNVQDMQSEISEGMHE